MKNIFTIACCIILLTISSCKKDALEINTDQTYVEQGVTAGDIGFGGIILTLMPDGKADLLPGGDIMERGTYKISGKNITVTIQDKEFKFDVVSQSELCYNKNRVLKLENR